MQSAPAGGAKPQPLRRVVITSGDRITSTERREKRQQQIAFQLGPHRPSGIEEEVGAIVLNISPGQGLEHDNETAHIEDQQGKTQTPLVNDMIPRFRVGVS